MAQGPLAPVALALLLLALLVPAPARAAGEPMAVTLSGEESIDGALCWRLELKAKAKNVTYDRIRYWVAKDQRRALKAEFLTVSGEVFKTATFEYGNVVTLAGAPVDFIKSMTIKDAMGSGAVSVLRFGPPKSDAHAPSLFNVNNVVR